MTIFFCRGRGRRETWWCLPFDNDNVFSPIYYDSPATTPRSLCVCVCVCVYVCVWNAALDTWDVLEIKITIPGGFARYAP